jgi:hypothetical protein
MRFTIRDLLWLMVVVGMAVGWWMDRSAMRQQMAEQWAAIRGTEIDLECIGAVVLDKPDDKVDLGLVREIIRNWLGERHKDE